MPPQHDGLSVSVIVPIERRTDAWRRYTGTCTITDASLNGDTFLYRLGLYCSGSEGPAEQWEVRIEVGGIEEELPFNEGVVVDLVVVMEGFVAERAAFAMRAQGELLAAGMSGRSPNVEAGMGDPQGLWAPLVVSGNPDQLCATQPGIDCPLDVGRNLLVFDGLDAEAIEVFDRGEASGDAYDYRVGDALIYVDDGSGDECDGGSPEWYDFFVLRRE